MLRGDLPDVRRKAVPENEDGRVYDVDIFRGVVAGIDRGGAFRHGLADADDSDAGKYLR